MNRSNVLPARASRTRKCLSATNRAFRRGFGPLQSLPNFDAWADLNGSNALQARRVSGNGVDQPLARVDAGGAAWYHQDVRGSVVALSDGSGTVQTHYAYDGFGNATVTGSTTFADGLRYTARLFDNSTGLQYSRARWYDPKTGRWQSEDPTGFAAGDANLYRYAGNQHTNASDPSGMDLTFRPLSPDVTIVLDSHGRYIGRLISINGVLHVIRNGIAIALGDVTDKDGSFWNHPNSSEKWWTWIQANGFAYDEHSDAVLYLKQDIDCQNATNGRGLNRADNVLGESGDRRNAGTQAAMLVIAMARSVGTEIAIQIGTTLIPFERFAAFAVKKGFAFIKDGEKYVLVNLKKGVRATAKEAEELAADAANAFAHQGRRGPLHHIATNKNLISTLRGGPWTPRFVKIFKKAGMALEDAANTVHIPTHFGPHPEAYHREIYDRLIRATNGLDGKAYKDALLKELDRIACEATTPGTKLNTLLTVQQ